MDSILLIDRDTTFLKSGTASGDKQFTFVYANSIATGLGLLKTDKVEVVLVEFSLLEQDNCNFIKTIKTDVDPHLPVIALADEHNLDRAAAAMRAGAFDVLPMTLSRNLLWEKIATAIRHRELEMRVNVLHTNVAETHDRMVFASDAMKRVHYEITRLANHEFDVLLCGETGVGKDLVAFELHRRSVRASKPFITLALRTLSETLIESELFGHEKGAYSGADVMKIGKLEAADEGTLYVPEISSLSETIQLKLLQFLQYKTITRVGQDARKPEIPVKVKIVFATNEKLEDLLAKGKLREDFYYRISGVKISIPPLRERPEDIELLLNYFLSKYGSSTEYYFTPEVSAALKSYRWPGNVRELENCIKHMLAMASDGELKLPHYLSPAKEEDASDRCRVCLGTRFAELPEYSWAEAQFKRAYFSDLLARVGNNIPLAASVAGMTPQGVRKIIKTLKIR